MRKVTRINLIGVPWPVNLLKCSRYTDAMQPGEKIVISLEDEDVRDNMVLILKAMPGITFDVCTKADCYKIRVVKDRPPDAGKDGHCVGGV